MFKLRTPAATVMVREMSGLGDDAMVGTANGCLRFSGAGVSLGSLDEAVVLCANSGLIPDQAHVSPEAFTLLVAALDVARRAPSNGFTYGEGAPWPGSTP